jgi:hypothetical protein
MVDGIIGKYKNGLPFLGVTVLFWLGGVIAPVLIFL